ncbi:epoxide hydrolase, partial [Burkholderia multivorans]
MQPFSAPAFDADLDDLRARLTAARLPEREPTDPAATGADRWAQGVPLADLTELVA